MTAALDFAHGKLVFGWRIRRLAELIAPALPRSARVLDVGCGDGMLAARVMQARPDVAIEGVDTLRRPACAIPCRTYDGLTLPFANDTFDALVCVDVLHHAGDAARVLRECGRVTRGPIIVKDHLREGFLAFQRLRFMDWVGNARHGVALPYTYFTRTEWRGMAAGAGLTVRRWDERIALYPLPLELVFGRQLQVLMTLARG